MSNVPTKEYTALLVGDMESGKTFLRDIGPYLGAGNAVHSTGNIEATLVGGCCPLRFATNHGSI